MAPAAGAAAGAAAAGVANAGTSGSARGAGGSRLTTAQVFRIVTQAFRKNGLTIQADAAERLREVGVSLLPHVTIDAPASTPSASASTPNELEMQRWGIICTQVIARLKERKLTSTMVSADQLEQALMGMGEEDDAVQPDDAIVVIDAFTNQPRFRYDSVSQRFQALPCAPPMFGSADDKSAIYLERRAILLQRTLRHREFSTPASRTSLSAHQHRGTSALAADSEQHSIISSIQSLRGTSGRRTVLAMLTQIVDGKLFLEDDDAYVECDASSVYAHYGLFTDNTMVLAEGEMNANHIFVLYSILLPPCESRDATLARFPVLDLIAAQLAGDRVDRRLQRLQADLDATNDTHMIVVVSDVRFDDAACLAKLARLFDGFASVAPPHMFVLMGPFVTHAPDAGALIAPPVTSAAYEKLLQQPFDTFADLVAQHPSLAHESRWVFVPGASDPGLGDILPRRGISPILTKKLRDKLRHCSFPSNPCRILYYTRELCFFRENLLHKVRRSCLLPPSVSNENDAEAAAAHLSQELVRTLLDQAHLSPLPITTRPIVWNYDHALRLYPLPSALFLGDAVEQFQWTYEGCAVSNVGSFADDGNFVVYYPASNRVEMSCVESSPADVSLSSQ